MKLFGFDRRLPAAAATLTLTAPPAAAGRYRATFLAVARTLGLSGPILHP